MSDNTQLMREELQQLGYEPKSFESSLAECPGEGVKFQYEILDGSRAGETVTLGLVIPVIAGEWPEATPHWIHISPPDSVLAEQVQAHRGNGRGSGTVRYHQDDEGTEWMAISAPVRDFWDQIKEVNGKNMVTYLDQHMRRIWGAR